MLATLLLSFTANNLLLDGNGPFDELSAHLVVLRDENIVLVVFMILKDGVGGSVSLSVDDGESVEARIWPRLPS